MTRVIELPDETAALLAQLSRRTGRSEAQIIVRWAEENTGAEDRRAAKIAEMQRLVTEGLESGVSQLSLDEILAEERARAAEGGRPQEADERQEAGREPAGDFHARLSEECATDIDLEAVIRKGQR